MQQSLRLELSPRPAIMNALELDLATAVERQAAMTRTVALLRRQRGVTTPTPEVPRQVMESILEAHVARTQFRV
jgi:hypothetical protein